MITLEELVKKHGLPLKLMLEPDDSYPEEKDNYDYWFEIRYEYCGKYFGHYSDMQGGDFEHSETGWKLYEEPKKLVPWYRWMWRHANLSSSQNEWITTHYFKTEEEMLKQMCISGSGFKYFRDDESMRMWPE